MSRIFYGKNPPRSFLEENQFNSRHPYYIRIKSFPNDDIAPPHYADDTLEIMLCQGVCGNIIIEEKLYRLSSTKNYVLVIPPSVVHSSHIKCCDGVMHVMHISIIHTSTYIDIKNILGYQSIKIQDLFFAKPPYDNIMKHVSKMVENDENLIRCMGELFAILLILIENLEAMVYTQVATNIAGNIRLKKIIKWSSENYTQHISLSQAAGVVGLSKNYFCSWFKDVTGMTYLNYLNQIRIKQACRYMNSGMSVNESGYACGFEDISYYIQLFKRIQGCTPKTYIRNRINR